MFSEALFVCLLAGCLVRPNEAKFQIKVSIQQAAESLSGTIGKTVHACYTAMPLLEDLQTSLQNSTNTSALALQVSEVYASVTLAEVKRLGGYPAKIPACIAQFQSLVTAVETETLSDIVSTCLTVAEAVSTLDAIISMSEIRRSMVVEMWPFGMTACPPPAPGDPVGGMANEVCVTAAMAALAKDAVFQALVISAYGTRIDAIVADASAKVSDAPACVRAKLSGLRPLPIAQCTFS